MKALITAVILVGGFALSWGICVGVMKLITLCFKWDFSLLVATGIWLVLCLLDKTFGK